MATKQVTFDESKNVVHIVPHHDRRNYEFIDQMRFRHRIKRTAYVIERSLCDRLARMHIKESGPLLGNERNHGKTS